MSGPAEAIADAANGTGLWCLSCGYDLRGMKDGQSCPECGRNVADSIQMSTWLSDRAVAITQLASALWWLVVALPLSGIAGIIYFSVGFRFYWIDDAWDIVIEALLWLPFITTLVAGMRLSNVIAVTALKSGVSVQLAIVALLVLRFLLAFLTYWAAALGTAPALVDDWVLWELERYLACWFAIDAALVLIVSRHIAVLFHRIGYCRLARSIDIAAILFMLRGVVIVLGMMTPLGNWMESVTDWVPEPLWISIGILGVAGPLAILSVVSGWAAVTAVHINRQLKQATR